jgi:uncharacterized protein YbcC (UPF0753/DUF2309 family)
VEIRCLRRNREDEKKPKQAASEIIKSSVSRSQVVQFGKLQTNDAGNTVIVPKRNESFADTMQRAAAYGKTVTLTQVSAELATAPAKAAAPAIDAAGAAALSVGDLLPSATNR